MTTEHSSTKNANQALDENLAPGEAVQVIIRGNLSSAIIGSDRRLFVFKKGWLSGSAFGKKMATWDYRNVTGVQIETGVLSGTVAVQAAGRRWAITAIGRLERTIHRRPLTRSQ